MSVRPAVMSTLPHTIPVPLTVISVLPIVIPLPLTVIPAKAHKR